MMVMRISRGALFSLALLVDRMLSSSKATCALTSRACEWVEAFEKIVPLHLKLKSWTVNRWKSNVKK